MAKKGLEEFKDVGGCWGCGLQLQLNQDIEDIKQLKAENDNLKDDIDKQQLYVDSLEQENERLKEEKGGMQILIDNYIALTEKYHQALQDIRDIAEKMYNTNDEDVERDFYIKLQAIINEVIGAEE